MKKKKVSEVQLLKALNDLEDEIDSIAKGDALQNADHDGGFSTEGADIREHAKRKMTAKAMAESEDEDEDEDEEEDDDKDMEYDKSMEYGKKKKKKGMKKSLTETLADDDALEVSDFLRSLTDELDTRLEESNVEVTALRKALVASHNTQLRLQQKLGKALVLMGRQNDDLASKLDDVLNQPAAAPARRGVVSKSEIAEPSRQGDPTGANSLTHQQCMDWLVSKACEGKIDSLVPTVYEAEGLGGLRPEIVKAMENDMIR